MKWHRIKRNAHRPWCSTPGCSSARMGRRTADYFLSLAGWPAGGYCTLCKNAWVALYEGALDQSHGDREPELEVAA